MRTPRQDNFYMPAEWHFHSRCWMGWPCRPPSWPFGIAAGQASYAAVARAIACFEPVSIIAPCDQVSTVSRLLGNHCEVISLPMNDAWLRDMGPTFVINPQGQLAGVQWGFNAWGCSHADHAEDAQLPTRLLKQYQIPCYTAPLVMEGGAIHVDGEGTVLTTEHCLLNPNRNPHLNQAEIETLLCDYLGVNKVLWLGQGLQDDETAGHIDNLACFVRPGVVVALTSRDPSDANYLALQDNLKRLRCATDACGRKLEVIPIEQPTYRAVQGLRLTLSYINFYIANTGIIVPIFNDPADAPALETLSKLFPDRQIAPVCAVDLLHGGGGIHCITQQQPVANS